MSAAPDGPWFLPLLAVVAAVDAAVLVVPSDPFVLAAGALSAAGRVPWAVVVAVTAAGALLGEHLAYAAGRRGGRHLPGRAQDAVARFGPLLARRGALVLLAARFVPTGRTAAAAAAGAARYPLARFSACSAVGACLSAAWIAGLGYLGGALLGMAAAPGLVLAGVGPVLVAAALYRRRRRSPGRTAPAGASPAGGRPPSLRRAERPRRRRPPPSGSGPMPPC